MHAEINVDGMAGCLDLFQNNTGEEISMSKRHLCS
jgi:hypothetical protein